MGVVEGGELKPDTELKPVNAIAGSLQCSHSASELEIEIRVFLEYVFEMESQIQGRWEFHVGPINWLGLIEHTSTSGCFFKLVDWFDLN